ncbi:MAG: tRNA (guanosine(37)-N1)-methyltransferase TrmD [Acidimicrobiales bacterium]
MSLRIDVFTIFPEMVDAGARESVIGRGRRDGHLDLRVHDLRSTTTDVHGTVDDAPFGGGAGMVMMPEPLFGAVEAVEPPRPLFYLSPAGRTFDQPMAHELAESGGFSLLCGRYEGIDERVREHLVDGEVSVGDVVLAGGEVGALLIIEAVGRLVPGVLGNATSTDDESFADGLLEYPHYTRPADFRGWSVPDVLRSGDHAKVARWRRAQALRRTMARRPDMIEARGGIGPADQKLLDEFDL